VKRGQIFTIFSGLTVIIACLGLLGLAAYTTQQRDKEIGIRKVIGASVTGIVLLIYKDFFVLIGIAVLLAFPAAYYFMNNWLSSFAYQTDIKVITFLASALLTILITILAVGFHTIRAARANPVKSLKNS
jgi:putative ABC transport system permease protein